MNRLVPTLAAIALAAPSIAFAAPAAQSLSLSNAAALQPVRASTAVGKKSRLDGGNDAVLIVAGILILAGIACALWCDGSDSP